MEKFELFKKYVFNISDEKWRKSKQAFFNVDNHQIVKAEKIIGREFPNQLKSFYENIGYGFTCNKNNLMTDKILEPIKVAKLWEHNKQYDDNSLDSEKLEFYEVDDDSYIYMDLNELNSKGEAPIYYYGLEIAKSFTEFVTKLERRQRYYINIANKVIESEDN